MGKRKVDTRSLLAQTPSTDLDRERKERDETKGISSPIGKKESAPDLANFLFPFRLGQEKGDIRIEKL